MRVVVTGASGNVGTSVLAALAADPAVESIVGLARRRPRMAFPKTSWTVADVSETDLVPIFADADVVIHLAWLIQPSRDEELTRRVNVIGSERVFGAVARAGVPALVHSSSVGAYAASLTDRPVDEMWPTSGIESSFHSRQKAEVEGLLDAFQTSNPARRVVRMRPAFIFKRDAASAIRRRFLGPLLPGCLMGPGRLPLLPVPLGLRFQAVHSADVAEAYRLAATRPVAGAFNIAADPVLDARRLRGLLRARAVELPARSIRSAARASWQLRLHPTPPSWLDIGMLTPIMDVSRARDELGWAAKATAEQAVLELLEGLREHTGIDTPPLSPSSGGPLRWREFRAGIGARGL